jgi:hypothetical protein
MFNKIYTKEKASLLFARLAFLTDLSFVGYTEEVGPMNTITGGT